MGDDRKEFTDEELKRALSDAGQVYLNLSVKDEQVKTWMADPATYPTDLRERVAFLWKTWRMIDGKQEVAYLFWWQDGHKREVCQDWARPTLPAGFIQSNRSARDDFQRRFAGI